MPTLPGPMVLKQLKVTRPPNTYLLLISYRSPDPRLAADVANAIAHSYLEHTYNIRFRSSASLSQFMEKQLEELKAKMERSSAALAQFERELNVINPEEKTSILSARLLQLNTDYTNAQTDRVRKEATWNSVPEGRSRPRRSPRRAKRSASSPSAQRGPPEIRRGEDATTAPITPSTTRPPRRWPRSSGSCERAARTPPSASKWNTARPLNRETMLQKAVAETKAEFDRLNARSFEYQALKREAEADKKLYEELVRKIKEAGINAGFQNSAIRIADPARPAVKPVFPIWAERDAGLPLLQPAGRRRRRDERSAG